MSQSSLQSEAAGPSPFLSGPGLSGNDLLLWSALPDLTLNIAQTAALCGVSVRQLGYWTKQGYVAATGRGVRRLYGPDALRRILSIRQAMHNGLSLRQALRALEASSPGLLPLGSPIGGEVLGASIDPALSPADADALAASLITLFDRNSQTRDNASGLASKLGRAADDVRRIAEHLAAQGALRKILAGGEVIFARAERSAT